MVTAGKPPHYRPLIQLPIPSTVAKKIREHVGVEGGYHIIPKSRDGLLKFQPKQDELPNRSMLDSQTTAQVLLETDALLRQRFVYGRGLLRMGRIIEELDLLAGK